MNWIHYSYLTAILSSIWSISVKEGIMSSFSIDFTAWYAIVSVVISFLVNVVLGKSLKLVSYLMIGGCLAGCTTIFLTKSLETSPNPGMSMAIFRTQSVLIALAAFLFFGSRLSVDTIFAMFAVIIGVFVITKATEKNGNTVQEEQEKQEEQEENRIDNLYFGNINSRKKWISYALLASLCITGKDLITKTSFFLKTAEIHQVIFNILLGQALILVSYDLYQTGNLNLEKKNNKDRKSDKKRAIWITLWTGFIFFVYIFTLTKATKLSSNVGYVKSIDTFGIIITTIASHYLFKSALNSQILLGISIIFFATLYISGFNVVNKFY